MKPVFADNVVSMAEQQLRDRQFYTSTNQVAVANLYEGTVNFRLPLVHVPMNGGLSLDVTVTNVPRASFVLMHQDGKTHVERGHYLGGYFSIVPGVTPHHLASVNENVPMFLDPQGGVHIFYPGENQQYYSVDGWYAKLAEKALQYRGEIRSPDGTVYEISGGLEGHWDEYELSPLTEVRDVTGKNWVKYSYNPAGGDYGRVLKEIRNSEGYWVQFQTLALWANEGCHYCTDHWRPSMGNMKTSDGKKILFYYGGGREVPFLLTEIHEPAGNWFLKFGEKGHAGADYDTIFSGVHYPNEEDQQFQFAFMDKAHPVHGHARPTGEIDYRVGNLGKQTFHYSPQPNDREKVEVISDGVRKEYIYEAHEDRGDTIWDTGLLLSMRVYSESDHQLQQEIINTWTHRPVGIHRWAGAEQPLLAKRVITQDGATYIQENVYDEFGYPIETHEVGNATRTIKRSYLHDTAHWIHRLTQEQVIDAQGTVVSDTRLSYNVLGQLIQRTVNGIQTDYAYDDGSNLLTETDALGHQTRYEDYYAGQARHIVSAGVDQSIEIRPDGLVTAMLNNLTGAKTAYRYDKAGRLVEVQKPLEETTHIVWQLPRSGDRTITQGHYRRVISRRDPTDSEADRGYRLVVQEESRDLETGATTWQEDFYGDRGLLRLKRRPLSSNAFLDTHMSYDALGRVTETQTNTSPPALTLYGQNQVVQVDRDGHQHSADYIRYADPTGGYVGAVENGLGHRTVMHRDAIGRITSIVQGKLARRYMRDPVTHLVVDEENPETGITHYAYDALGQVIRKLVGGVQTDYQYDDANRLVGLRYQAGSGSQVATTEAIDYVYEKGRLVEKRRGQSRWVYDYDAADRVVSAQFKAQDLSPLSFQYAYDALGYLSRFIYPDGKVLKTRSNALGQTSSIADIIPQASYDPGGTLSGYTTADHHTVAYPREPALGRMAGLIVQANGSPLVNIGYRYNWEHLLEIEDRLVPNSGYHHLLAYDAAHQLIEDQMPSGTDQYRYDRHHNIIQKTTPTDVVAYAYDDHNRLARLLGQSGETALAYDGLGNVIQKGFWRYQFNARNELISAIKSEGEKVAGLGDAGLKSAGVSYRYDADGSRYWVGSGDSGRVEIHLNNRLVYRQDADGHVQDYVYLGDRLVGVLSGGDIAYRYTDLLGSVVAGSGGSSAGQLGFQRFYQGFGKEFGVSGLGEFTGSRGDSSGSRGGLSGSHIGFTGKVLDLGTGLNYFQARYYDAGLGRFLSMDPAGVSGSGGFEMNRYAYGNNNPYRYADPTGMWAESLMNWGSWQRGFVRGADALGSGFAYGLTWGMMDNGFQQHNWADSVNYYLGLGFGGITSSAFIKPTSLSIGNKFRQYTQNLSNLFSKKHALTIEGIFSEKHMTKASELRKFAENQGWKAHKNPKGPWIYKDQNGVKRITIKKGSLRTPGSSKPHVELRNANGNRIDVYGNQIAKKSLENHTPIEYDL